MSQNNNRAPGAQVERQVTHFVQANFVFTDDQSVNADQSLLASGLIDSTNVLELITFMEETFGIDIPDEDLVPVNLDSISRITNYVDRKLEEKYSSAASS